MKTSFYLVLWQLVVCSTMLNMPFLYGFFLACIIVFFADRIIRKLLKNQIEYQYLCEAAFIMEMAYNNDYKEYKRQALIQMIVFIVAFVYILLCFIAFFTLFSGAQLIDYIRMGTLVILAGISASWYIRSYIQVRKAGRVTLDKGLQEIYQSYKAKRDTHTCKEMLLPRPKYYQVINAAHTLCAIFNLFFGLILTTIPDFFNGKFGSEVVFKQFVLAIYGILAIYFGIKDLLSMSCSKKYILLLLSWVMAVYGCLPTIHYYINKVVLAAYIADAPDLTYNAKDNLVQETITFDELDGFKTTYLKQRSMIFLSRNDRKELLKWIIRTSAEYQVVYRDVSNDEQIVAISPSELKEIYHQTQTKSNLDILIEILRLDYKWEKVYDDGENIIIEIYADKNVSYPTQSEYPKRLTRLTNLTKEIAEDYDIEVFDRGLTVRNIFNDDRFIEHTLSLEELKKKKNKQTWKKSEKDSTRLFNIFSNNLDNNE